MNSWGLAAFAAGGAIIAGAIKMRIRGLEAAGFVKTRYGAWERKDALTPQDWAHRWQKHHIGFHMKDVNPGAGTVVIVPLCGKTVDLRWLAAHEGVHVLGIEVVEQAIGEFFEDQEIERVVRDVAGVRVHEAMEGRLRIAEANIFSSALCSDAFRAATIPAGWSTAVWDRAALVAINPDDRARYLGAVAAVAGPGASWLLSTFTYDQDKMAGPPFSVADGLVSELLGDGVPTPGGASIRAKEVALLEREELPAATLGRWGVPWARQSLFLISL